MIGAFEFILNGAVYVLAFFVAIMLLVTAHELGHYIVARCAGVKVLAFSVGFGPRIAKWVDRRGTEFVLAAIPLGGYVRMLECKVDEVAPEDWDKTFDKALPGWRIAIALAGPFANFGFSILVLCCVILIYGKPFEVPYIGSVTEGSPAHEIGVEPGERIIEVNDVPTSSWPDVSIQLIERVGEFEPIPLTTSSGRYELRVKEWKSEKGDLDIYGSVGFLPGLKPIVDTVGRNSPAERAGIVTGDLIYAIDDVRTPDWRDVVSAIQASPQQRISVHLIRGGADLVVSLTPESKTDGVGNDVGFANMGVRASVERVEYSPWNVIPVATRDTWQLASLTLTGLYKIVVGDISVRGLGGPITIAKVGGDSVRRGLEVYLRFLAILSISLGLINLMPVPILDGGHVLFGVYELLLRKPASDQLQLIASRIGMVLIAGLIVLCLYNDSLRLLGL